MKKLTLYHLCGRCGSQSRSRFDGLTRTTFVHRARYESAQSVQPSGLRLFEVRATSTKPAYESKKWADRAFALHLWSMHVGKPEQRITRVKELGYLFVEERPPAACDRLPH